MQLLGLFVIFAVTFLLFLLIILWAQWRKQTRPFVREFEDDGILPAADTVKEKETASLRAPEIPRTLPIPKGESPLIGAAEEAQFSKSRPAADRQNSVLPSLPVPSVLAVSEPFQNAAAITREAGDRYQFPRQADPVAARPTAQEVVVSSAVPKEIADATWLRFHYHSPAAPKKPNKARQGTQARVVEDALRQQEQRGIGHLFISNRRDKLQSPQGQPPIPPPGGAGLHLSSAVHTGSDVDPKAASQGGIRSAATVFGQFIAQKERFLVLALWWIAVPTALIFAFYPSKTVEMRLRSDPPADFYYRQKGLSSRREAAERELARAYWKCAAEFIQYEYAPHTDLPLTPPPEFNVEGSRTGYGKAANDLAVRERYWEKLREVWTKPSVWQRSRTANTSWLNELLNFFQAFFENCLTTVQSLA